MADPRLESHPVSIDTLAEENLRLKAELKRQQEMYENSHLELIKYMVETERQSKELKRLNRMVSRAFLNTIEIIQAMIDLREPGYYDHSMRVADISRSIARKQGLQQRDIQQISIAARIHEIGKISIPDAIFHKPFSRLTERERQFREHHYIIGANLLERIPSFRKIAHIIRSISEYYDGSGTPDGLRADDIPLGARIIALANVWDSLFFVEQVFPTPLEALQAIEDELDRKFDRRLFPFLKAEVLMRYSEKDQPTEKQVPVPELKPGMVLSRDLITVTNVLLVPKKTQLEPRIIEKIQKYQSIDPVQGGVFVTRESVGG